ncbi:hypothetical protein A9Q74_12100 [Colwellia sp. 39_35_sub15_T18]|nr:hypothetical protein A9Q74_12100 [Colwellia sp. 39_35_sub15_T18]
MLLYAILSALGGFFVSKQAKKIRTELQSESDLEIREALEVSAKKRDSISKWLYLLSVLFFVATIIILGSIS